MSQTRDLLNYWLGQCYAAEVVKGDRSGAAVANLAKQIEANQNLQQDAQNRLNEITDDLEKQDFISKKHKEFLKRAIGAQPQ